jgi:hypothetical protein
MNLKFVDCAEKKYNTESFEARLDYRLLYHPIKGKLEVECITLPEVKGHSDEKYNLMLKDKNEKLEEDDRKYFTNITYFQKRKILWMFGISWIQRDGNVWKIINPIIGFASGYLLYYFTHNCN